MTLDAGSNTLSPLPGVLSHGLVAVSTFGLLSFFCSTSLFLFLTYKLIRWRRTTGIKAPINQFLFLIYNLLLAGENPAMFGCKPLTRHRRCPTSNCLPSKYQCLEEQCDRSGNFNMLRSRMVRLDRRSRK